MLIRTLPEGKALVYRDIADTELDCFIDELEPDLVVEKESLAIGLPLRVRLSCGDLAPRGHLIHCFEVAGRIRIDAAAYVEPMCATKPLDDPRCGSPASSIVSGSSRRVDGMNGSTIKSVSESIKTSLINSS